MTLEELITKINERELYEIKDYELQFHHNCLWYHIDKVDRIDDKNKRIILECESKNKPKEDK